MDIFESYPELPIDIIIGFSVPESRSNEFKPKKIWEFCNEYQKKHGPSINSRHREIIYVCEKLVFSGHLICAHRAGVAGMENQYYSILKDPNLSTDRERQLAVNQLLSYRIYGFPFIYREFKSIVHPIINVDKNGDKAIGTCFQFANGIITAKHTFDNAKNIAIRGFSKEQLYSAKYFTHKNPMFDILYAEIEGGQPNKIINHNEANILDEIITMGYPKVSGFHDFLAIEKAIISSRITTSTGQLVAKADDIWIKEQLLLITARVKGGNSGGPVINSNGEVIGVIVSDSKGEGDYDDLGYGTAIPMTLVNDDIILKKSVLEFDTTKIEFNDFNE